MGISSATNASCQIKLKWHSFFLWVKSSHRRQRSQQRRQQEQQQQQQQQCCGFCGHMRDDDEQQWTAPVPPPRRGSKSSHTSDASAGTTSTSWSTSSKPIISLLFRRRASASGPEMEEIERERGRIESLYALAVDELNFAEDSQGSPYYEGDRITAREAIDNCTSAFMQLLRHISDYHQRTQLQQAITPRLMHLQDRYNTLPCITTF